MERVLQTLVIVDLYGTAPDLHWAMINHRTKISNFDIADHFFWSLTPTRQTCALMYSSLVAH